MKIHIIQHVAFEGPDAILTWARERNHTLSETRVDKGDSFPAAPDFDLLVVMGGPMAVYETAKYPWISAELALIRQALDAGKKVLGVCLGSQMLAAALGAKVYRHTEREIGWYPIFPTEEGKEFGFEERTVLHWHGDTFDLPPSTIHLAHSEACQNQAFLYGSQGLGLQFHTEVSRRGLDEFIENIPPAPPARWVQSHEAIARHAGHTDHSISFLGVILDKFVSLK